MISLSDNEFSVISFLVRNFTEKLTIRSIAQKLNFSPAGVFNILKKLEKQNIVTGEKLGTGLFYSINFENRIAQHLASIVLVYNDEKISLDISQFRQAKAAVFSNKTLLLITDSMTSLDASIPNVTIISKTEDEFVSMLRKKDAEALQVLKKGIVLFGEDNLVEIIKKCITGF
ncbi:winged helix-turn-helix transcriptional regulator [Candidatus Woesearchaeota archaeon]|nr:winged helix-turn-helix transcriptional regulator [Candidatus Woesearchaeota archaeon]